MCLFSPGSQKTDSNYISRNRSCQMKQIVQMEITTFDPCAVPVEPPALPQAPQTQVCLCVSACANRMGLGASRFFRSFPSRRYLLDSLCSSPSELFFAFYKRREAQKPQRRHVFPVLTCRYCMLTQLAAVTVKQTPGTVWRRPANVWMPAVAPMAVLKNATYGGRSPSGVTPVVPTAGASILSRAAPSAQGLWKP